MILRLSEYGIAKSAQILDLLRQLVGRRGGGGAMRQKKHLHLPRQHTQVKLIHPEHLMTSPMNPITQFGCVQLLITYIETHPYLGK